MGLKILKRSYSRRIRLFSFRIILTFSLTLGSLLIRQLIPGTLAITPVVTTSSTTAPTQPSTMRHLLRTSDATLHAFVQLGTNTSKCGSGGLWWLNSTDSGANWNCGSQLSSDTTNLMYADGRTDSSDNIYLVYSVATSGGNTAYDVSYRTLTASNCSPSPCEWTVQTAQTVLDGDASGDNAGFHYATIELQGTSRAWIAVREYDGTNYQVGTYYSDSLGNAPVWTESVATLDTSGTNASYHLPTIVRYSTNIGVIWNDQTTGDLMWRYRGDSDGLTSWNTVSTIANRLTRFPTFSAVGDAAGNIYLSVQDSTVAFYHYLSSWSAGATVASPSVSDQFTSVSTDGANVYVAYGDTTGIIGGINRKLAYKKGVPPFATANFDSNPTAVVSYHGIFDKFWLYDASANTYEDETVDAGDIGTADIFHSSSSSIVKDTGDILYLGKLTTFDAIDWVLSTNGTGAGTLVWEYCSAVDGSLACTTWSNLTFTASSQNTFKGGGSGSFTPPTDWVLAKVNDDSTANYYIRARATADYTVGPVGTEITSTAFSNWASLAATTGGVYAIWTENTSSPSKIRYSTILSFNSNPNAPTALGSHIDGSFIADSSPTLTFSLSDSDASDTVKYRIQIDDSSDFNSPMVDYTSSLAAQGAASFSVGQNTGSGSYATGSSGQTLSEGSYYWRVKTIDDDAVESSYSTANSGGVAYIVDTTSPSIPGTPSTSSSSTNTTPTWTWTISTDSGAGLSTPAYTLQWSQSPTFASGVSSATNTTNTYKHTSALSDGNWYFRVKASDSVGNESSYSSSGSTTVDATPPTSVLLQSPSNYSYTNSERPIFKWKANNDAIGLAKFVLEIDNPSIGSDQPSSDFTIDNIPTSGTTSLESNKYVIHFENFSDSDNNNNYISVNTKSHSDWGSSENDGKLREGKVNWRVKAIDTAGNETSATWTVFVDKNNPTMEISQINATPYTASNYSTTDPTPTIFGKITDSLSGGDMSQTQEKTGPRVASGPKKIDIKIEKSTTFGYELVTLYTINADKIYFNCNDKEITDNSKQECDKYLLFEYNSSQTLAKGIYKFTFTGFDMVDNNSSQIIINLNISPSSQETTWIEKQPLANTTDSKSKKEQPKTDVESYITKTLEPTTLELAQEKIAQEAIEITKESSNFISGIFIDIIDDIEKAFEISIVATSKATSSVGETYNRFANNEPDFIKSILQAIDKNTSTTTNSFSSTSQKIFSATSKVIQKSGSNIKNGVDSVRSTASTLGKNARNGILNIGLALGNKTKGIGGNFSLAIIEFSYKFVPEPTTISQVKVTEISSTSVKISWETNQPANGKINYGLDRTYPFDIQTENRSTYHEFTLTDLQPNTTYHFEIMSHGKNYVYDANREFKTLKQL